MKHLRNAVFVPKCLCFALVRPVSRTRARLGCSFTFLPVSPFFQGLHVSPFLHGCPSFHVHGQSRVNDTRSCLKVRFTHCCLAIRVLGTSNVMDHVFAQFSCTRATSG